jgi:hypothetical protein
MDALKNESWFPKKGFWISFILLLITYSASASSPKIFETINIFLNPLVDGLNYFGLGIIKSFMDGRNGFASPIFFKNLTGIAVYGVLLANFKALFFFYRHNWSLPLTSNALKLLSNYKLQKNSWIGLLAGSFCYLFITLFAILCVLNGVNGWIVFHFQDFLMPIVWSFLFLLMVGSIIIGGFFAFLKLLLISFGK